MTCGGRLLIRRHKLFVEAEQMLDALAVVGERRAIARVL